MDIGKITQLAKGEFGAQARSVYHQDRTGPSSQNHLKVDDLGAGDFVFVDSGVNGSNPQHSQNADGLLLSVERPVATGTMGSWAAAIVQNIQLPRKAWLFVGNKEGESVTFQFLIWMRQSLKLQTRVDGLRQYQDAGRCGWSSGTRTSRTRN